MITLLGLVEDLDVIVFLDGAFSIFVLSKSVLFGSSVHERKQFIAHVVGSGGFVDFAIFTKAQQNCIDGCFIHPEEEGRDTVGQHGRHEHREDRTGNIVQVTQEERRHASGWAPNHEKHARYGECDDK